jgi:metal-responsive CopG/Arc/MetJ family transcriptional regulator
MAKVRTTVEMSEELTNFLDTIANREGATRIEMIRRSLSILKAYDASYQKGRKHIGFVDDPSKLDLEIVGVFN